MNKLLSGKAKELLCSAFSFYLSSFSLSFVFAAELSSLISFSPTFLMSVKAASFRGQAPSFPNSHVRAIHGINYWCYACKDNWGVAGGFGMAQLVASWEWVDSRQTWRREQKRSEGHRLWRQTARRKRQRQPEHHDFVNPLSSFSLSRINSWPVEFIMRTRLSPGIINSIICSSSVYLIELFLIGWLEYINLLVTSCG